MAATAIATSFIVSTNMKTSSSCVTKSFIFGFHFYFITCILMFSLNLIKDSYEKFLNYINNFKRCRKNHLKNNQNFDGWLWATSYSPCYGMTHLICVSCCLVDYE
uniref:Uncharacterized protein n=1 Tax=Glossina pallidipes TaxID=7398 RepID=A0A1B0AK87_GLOPL